MKNSLQKRILALLLSMVLVLSGSTYALAEQMAETSTVEIQEEIPAEVSEVTETADLVQASEEAEAPQESEEQEAVQEETTTVEETVAEETVAQVSEEAEVTEDTTAQSEEQTTESEAVETETTETETIQTMEYEDADVKVNVTEVTANAIPENASLKVVPILQNNDETKEQYEAVETELQSKAEDEEYDIVGFLAYDITFVDENGNEIEPNGEVKVTMNYKNATMPEAVAQLDEETTPNVTVMHLEENIFGNVKDVVDMVADENTVANVQTDSSAAVTNAEFVTDSFSVYTITWTAGPFTYSLQANVVDAQGNAISGMSDYTDSSLRAGNEYVFANECNSLTVSGITYTFVKAMMGSSFANSSEIYSVSYSGNGPDSKLRYKTNSSSNWSDVGSNKIYLVYESQLSITATAVNENYETLTTTTIPLTAGTAYNLSDLSTLEVDSTTYNYISAYVLDGETKVPVTSVIYKDSTYYYIVEDGTETALGDKTLYLVYEADRLHTVETVDHVSDGIVMRMIDYSSGGDNFYGLGGGYGGGQGAGTIEYNLVSNKLSNGYPETAAGQSLAGAFSGGTTVNHLFIKSTYDQTGYYEYNCFENFAYLEDGTNFTVYEELGTPNGSTSENHYFYQRGNFLPYNPIVAGKYAGNTNKYDEYGALLTGNRAGEALYQTQADLKTQDNPNYYFGMYMEVPFVQPKDGQVEWNNSLSPMRYEFNGDDDLWIFIDDVLVLDIGGIHDAHSGYIDFATGEVGWYDCVTGGTAQLYTTTIKAMYQEAGVFPDGTAWDNSKVSEYFDGNTYIDYSAHTMKMFYMERGAGASNLHVKFNIPVIPKGTFEVSKELTNTDKEKYANVEFAFQAYAQKIVSTTDGVETYSDTEYVPLTEAVYEGTDTAIEFKDDQQFDGVEYDNVFYLKPGETAVFSNLQENRKYYVVEVGVNAQEFDEVVINGVGYKEFSDADQASGIIANVQTGKTEVLKRPLVVYENNCSVYNSRELQITKAMATGQTTEDTFTFKVLMENQDGEMVPYVGPYYLQDASGNYYTYVDGVLTKSGATAVVCGNTTSQGLIPDVGVGYTATITQILSGTEFAVSEINLPETYQTPSKSVTDCDAATIVGADGMIALGKDAEVVITNSYIVSTIDLDLKKTTVNGVSIEGAEFTLYMLDDDTWVEVKSVTATDEAGEALELTGLNAGRYKLVETKAPSGFLLLSSAIYFVVENEQACLTDENGQALSTSPDMWSLANNVLTVKNECVYELPSTGGNGIYLYMIAGVALMMLATAISYKNRRKGAVER